VLALERQFTKKVTKAGHYARMWKMQAGRFLPEKEDRDK
jgi:hypothetical protein